MAYRAKWFSHPVLASSAFQQDLVPFHVLSDRQQPIWVLTNDASAIAIQRDAMHPAWIWTDDTITENASVDFLCEIHKVFQSRRISRFVVKPSVVPVMESCWKEKAVISNDRTLIAYACESAVQPIVDSKIAIRPFESECDTLCAFFAGFMQDCYGHALPVPSYSELSRSAAACEDFLLLWVDGEPAAMAGCFAQDDRYARISYVYTAPHMRGKGCAKSLLSVLCSRLQAKGKIPILYADAANPVSNRLYQSIGFVPKGEIREVTVRWGKEGAV